MADPKPICGTQTVSQDSILKTLLAVLGALGTAAAVVANAVKLAQTGTAAAAAAALVVITIAVYYYDRCFSKSGAAGCSAGVVNEIQNSFSSASDWVFPFTAMHDRVDVVVKSSYWHLLTQAAGFVKCARDSRSSPILQNIFYSDEVCNAETGALVGGGVGAVGGILIAAAVTAAIGCTTFIVCLFALLLAAILAVVAALVGAFAGGMIGKAATSSTPAAPVRSLLVGTYLTTRGTLLAYGNLDDAVVCWKASAMLHGGPSHRGEGLGGGPPYSYPDPDAHLVGDGCEPLLPPPGIIASAAAAGPLPPTRLAALQPSAPRDV
jgi:hypothetical protein